MSAAGGGAIGLHRAEIPLSPHRRVQNFQRPTPSHVSTITPRAPRRGDDHVARGRRGRMKIRTSYSPLALFTCQRDDATAGDSDMACIMVIVSSPKHFYGPTAAPAPTSMN